MFWVAIERILSNDEIKEALSEKFNNINIFVGTLEEYCDINIGDDKTIFIETKVNQSDFPFVMDFNLCPDLGIENGYNFFLAEYFSHYFKCKTMIDIDEKYAPTSAPYWSLIFEQGKVFLGDDCGSDFYDQEGGRIKIIREIKFDKIGNYKGFRFEAFFLCIKGN